MKTELGTQKTRASHWYNYCQTYKTTQKIS